MAGLTHLRLMTWCPNALSGMHLPFFAASETGLFAEHGLDVEYVPAKRGPESVAAGDADLALTSIVHVLDAQTRAAGRLPVRFVATLHQRNPIVAVVRADSGRLTVNDLPGARTARWSSPWFADEYAGAMARLGLGPPVLVDTPGGLDEALGSGTVEVLPMWVDDTAPAHALGMTLYYREERFGVRSIALDIPVYSTGLVASDRVPVDVVRRVQHALSRAHEIQRATPEPGLTAFRRCFPEVTEEHARLSWALYEPYAFDGVAPGSMDAERWRDTITYAAATHGVASLAEDRVYRLD